MLLFTTMFLLFPNITGQKGLSWIQEAYTNTYQSLENQEKIGPTDMKRFKDS